MNPEQGGALTVNAAVENNHPRVIYNSAQCLRVIMICVIMIHVIISQLEPRRGCRVLIAVAGY
jgi:hypothetical protein